MTESKVMLGNGDLGPDATVDRNIMVSMRDGLEIACDVYRPAASGRYPVLYAVSPYIKDSVDLPTMGVFENLYLDDFKLPRVRRVLLVEQKAEAALKVAHDAAVLVDGKIVLSGNGLDILHNEQVGEIFLGKRVGLA